jgi:hypothetical protein
MARQADEVREAVSGLFHAAPTIALAEGLAGLGRRVSDTLYNLKPRPRAPVRHDRDIALPREGPRDPRLPVVRARAIRGGKR